LPGPGAIPDEGHQVRFPDYEIAETHWLLARIAEELPFLRRELPAGDRCSSSDAQALDYFGGCRASVRLGWRLGQCVGASGERHD
jgi:hypothetical protein